MKEKDKAWSKVAKTVKTYSDEMVERWSNEMDTLLVYVGKAMPSTAVLVLTLSSFHRRVCSPRS